MNASTRRRDPLAGTRPDFMPDPLDPVDPAHRERELRAIFDAPRPVDIRPPRRRLRVVAVAAGMVAAVVIAITPGADAPNAQASPRDVLLAAAEAVANTYFPTSGRYWHLSRRSNSINFMAAGPGHGSYLVVSESGSELWSSRTGAENSLDVSGIDIDMRPLTARDGVEWEKAGRPMGFSDVPLPPGAPPAPPMAAWRGGENAYNVAGANRSMDEVLALPTDAGELKAFLVEQYRKNGSPGETPKDVNEWLTWEAEGLLSYVPTSPGTRAAAYRLLADLPGYRVLDASELPDGAGVGLARTARGGWADVVKNGVIEHQIVIDPDTGLMTMERMTVVEPGGEKRKLPAGTVFYTETIDHLGWVDTEPVVPPGAEVYQMGG